MSLQQISNAPLVGNRLKGIGYKHYVLLILLLSATIRFTSLTDTKPPAC
ncbi:Uncharacterised protein [Serratia entomophila]|nr:hypothetical protein [Serratia entomophila]CAI0979230.1 Uncharacterised protein [Serratia entomophila]CAI0982817.1 Uncharacterised protein [Serratia entomophila]CAI0992955.1 Uncharacterised protein [Serratia entomophila]CAI0997523.1 Uncharacterised protein [Serratia entomophila]CAI1030715.1 Uncharacterised protein [Serratia entomophila]